MQRLFPPSASEVTDDDLVELYRWPDHPWLRANMVLSLDGVARGSDGKSGSISSPADRAVLQLLRATCDALVVGAGTVRAENYHPPVVDPRFAEYRKQLGLAELPVIVIVSNNLSVPATARVFSRGEGTTAILTSAASDPGRREELAQVTEVVVLDGDRVDPFEALAWLRSRGWRRLLTEGGPSLLGEWIGVVDEMCLTLSPNMVGAADPAYPAPDLLGGQRLPDDLGFDLKHLLFADGLLISAWHRDHSGADRPRFVEPD